MRQHGAGAAADASCSTGRTSCNAGGSRRGCTIAARDDSYAARVHFSCSRADGSASRSAGNADVSRREHSNAGAACNDSGARRCCSDIARTNRTA